MGGRERVGRTEGKKKRVKSRRELSMNILFYLKCRYPLITMMEKVNIVLQIIF